MAFDGVKYRNNFINEKYDRINLTVPKGTKEVVKSHAEKYDGGSVNAFIQRAIRETMERDEATAPAADAGIGE